MRRALFLYNPFSGNRRSKLRKIEAARKIFQSVGVEAEIETIRSPAEAAAQAKNAIAQDFDALIACGGDGTAHDIAQGMIGSTHGVALGVLPMGTGNVLAKNIKLPLEASRAARALTSSQPKRIAVGKIQFTPRNGAPHSGERYLLLNAGAGLDALGMYRSMRLKSRLGQAAYYIAGAHLLASYQFPMLEVEWRDETKTRRTESVSQLGAFRVPTLGGLVGCLTPGASFERDDLQLILFKTQSRRRLVHYSLRQALRMQAKFDEIELAHAHEVICRPLRDEAINVQADGEWLGFLPAKITMVPSALSLLFPAGEKM